MRAATSSPCSVVRLASSTGFLPFPSTPPNQNARTQLDGGLNAAKSRLLAPASRNEQDVIGLQFHIGRLAAEYVLEVDGNLLAPARRCPRTENLDRGRSGRRLEPFRQRYRL